MVAIIPPETQPDKLGEIILLFEEKKFEIEEDWLEYPVIPPEYETKDVVVIWLYVEEQNENEEFREYAIIPPE